MSLEKMISDFFYVFPIAMGFSTILVGITVFSIVIGSWLYDLVRRK